MFMESRRYIMLTVVLACHLQNYAPFQSLTRCWVIIIIKLHINLKMILRKYLWKVKQDENLYLIRLAIGL